MSRSGGHSDQISFSDRPDQKIHSSLWTARYKWTCSHVPTPTSRSHQAHKKKWIGGSRVWIDSSVHLLLVAHRAQRALPMSVRDVSSIHSASICGESAHISPADCNGNHSVWKGPKGKSIYTKCESKDILIDGYLRWPYIYQGNVFKYSIYKIRHIQRNNQPIACKFWKVCFLKCVC